VSPGIQTVLRCDAGAKAHVVAVQASYFACVAPSTLAQATHVRLGDVEIVNAS
jgi:hypothetical protein